MPAWFRDGTESPVERRVFSCIYAHFPQTQELARRLWEEQDRCGLRVERFEDGRSAEPVRA